jgi:hypothetical protein
MDLALGGSVQDEKLKETVKNIIFRKGSGVQMDENGTLWLKKGLCVPEDRAISESILGKVT